ncbi:MAG: helix-turn-helix domain-containing protein [Gammaproteobacteria bacterium]|nr:helix-turn-helix domain-containing protein [Gammaproteobacteria bacterium]
MTQPTELLTTLKSELRRRGLSYADVACRLEVSESTVKRLFAKGNFTLQRLSEVCAIAGLDIAELALIADERRRDVEQLSEAQEQALVADPKLMLMAFLLLNDWRVEDIRKAYAIEDLESIQLLARLDRLKLIELMVGNRPRMRLSRRFTWRAGGPIQRFFERQVQSEFFNSRFDGPGELRLVLNGMLSQQSIAELHERFAKLAEEFESRARDNRKLGVEQRQGTSAVLAIRPWSLSIFDAFRRTG